MSVDKLTKECRKENIGKKKQKNRKNKKKDNLQHI